jgi:hypothetical protein
MMTITGPSNPMRNFLPRARAAALILTLGVASTAVRAQSTSPPAPPVDDISPTIETLDASRSAGMYPVSASVDLHAGSPTARQALVIIHGRLRNASDYYATTLALIKAAGSAGNATVAIAPQFLNQIDITAHRLPDRYLRWNADWEQGAPAQGPAAPFGSGAAASSYDVLDDIVAKLSNTSAFPALKRIVFVGHGGGAQLLARYAIAMRPQPGPPISFVIANAGTYLYPIAARPVALDCPDFNRWKYGLDDPPPYVGDSGTILKNLATRNITLLLGTKDRKADGILDQSCAAQTQGRNRFERGRNFVQAMAQSGLAPLLKHRMVADVGHNERGMLLSREATEAIFASGNSAR